MAYTTSFYEDSIYTTVTKSLNAVTTWITETEHINNRRLVVGLDAEWRPITQRGGPENPVAIIQLCVGNRCLIFQIIHSQCYPHSLVNFLNNRNYTFTGCGIHDDIDRIMRHYGLNLCPNVVELGDLVTHVYGEQMRGAGLKRLANVVLGKEVDKSTNVRWSTWDNERLTPEQVAYATIDAFVSFEIARVLISMGARVY